MVSNVTLAQTDVSALKQDLTLPVRHKGIGVTVHDQIRRHLALTT